MCSAGLILFVHKMPVVNKKFTFQRVYDSLPMYFGIRTSRCAQRIALRALRILLPDFA